MRGNKWEEGEKVVEAQEEGEKEKRATSPQEKGGRGCLIAVRQIESE